MTENYQLQIYPAAILKQRAAEVTVFDEDLKIKADANPYLPEYAGYYYNRRHHSAAKEFNYLSAREYRASTA